MHLAPPYWGPLSIRRACERHTRSARRAGTLPRHRYLTPSSRVAARTPRWCGMAQPNRPSSRCQWHLDRDRGLDNYRTARESRDKRLARVAADPLGQFPAYSFSEGIFREAASHRSPPSRFQLAAKGSPTPSIAHTGTRARLLETTSFRRSASLTKNFNGARTLRLSDKRELRLFALRQCPSPRVGHPLMLFGQIASALFYKVFGFLRGSYQMAANHRAVLFAAFLTSFPLFIRLSQPNLAVNPHT